MRNLSTSSTTNPKEKVYSIVNLVKTASKFISMQKPQFFFAISSALFIGVGRKHSSFLVFFIFEETSLWPPKLLPRFYKSFMNFQISHFGLLNFQLLSMLTPSSNFKRYMMIIPLTFCIKFQIPIFFFFFF